MKKPFYQAMFEFIALAFMCLVVINTIVEAFTKTIPLVDLALAIQLSSLLIIIYVILLVLFNYRKIRWVGDKGEPLRVVKFNKGISWCFVCMILILWISPARQMMQQIMYKQHRAKAVYNSADQAFRVLILPFDKECDYQGKRYDIGEIIQRRLESMKRQDKINLLTYYPGDSMDFANFKHETADSLMKFHNADIILYGSYSLSQCEGGMSDKICFNYQTNAKRFGVDEMEQTEYKMHDIRGLDDVRRGTGQEGIDYVIYWVAGMSAVKAKDYDAAIARFQKIKNYRTSAHILFEVGNCYYYKGDYAAAQNQFEKSIAIDSNHAESWAHLGVIAAWQNKFTDARNFLEKGLKAEPDNFCGLKNLGLLYLSLKDTLAAKRQYEEIVKSNSEDDIVLRYVATLYKGIKDYRRAQELLEKSLQIHSYHPETWDVLGLVYRDMEDNNKALECFKKALALKPDHTSSLHYTGLVYLETKKYVEAKNTFEKVLNLDPGMENSWYSLGLTYLLLEKDQKAIKCLNKCVGLNPQFKDALYYLGMLHKKLGDYKTASQRLQQVVKIDSLNKEAWNHLGLAYAELKDYNHATRCFEKLSTLLPDHGAVFYNLASIASYQRDKNKALAYLNRALRLLPSLKEYVIKDKSFAWLSGEKQFIAMMD